jgi:hypothetical protein
MNKSLLIKNQIILISNILRLTISHTNTFKLQNQLLNNYKLFKRKDNEDVI